MSGMAPAATVTIRINIFLGYPHESPTKPSFAITVTGPHPIYPELILQGSASSVVGINPHLPSQRQLQVWVFSSWWLVEPPI